MKMPLVIEDLIITYMKLNKKNYMRIEGEAFLVSNICNASPAKPVFAEKVVSLSKRDDQWKRIKSVSADQRNCFVFKNKHDFNKWIKYWEKASALFLY